MHDVNTDGLDGVEMKVLTNGVPNEGSDHALPRRNDALLRLGGLLPHETQRVVDAVHRSRVARNVVLPIAEFILGNIADVAGLEGPTAGSLAVAEGALNGGVGIDCDDARAKERLHEKKGEERKRRVQGGGLVIGWLERVQTEAKEPENNVDDASVKVATSPPVEVLWTHQSYHTRDTEGEQSTPKGWR